MSTSRAFSHHAGRASGALLAALLGGFSAVAEGSTVAPAALAVPGAGFEEPGEVGLPLSWSLETAEPKGSVVRRDEAVRHGGASSLRMESPRPASVSVVSEPFRLEVGRPYRLRAWVRTEGAVSDPLARYPTAVAACLGMTSWPFTNHSPALGATRDWTLLEEVFVATAGRDRVRLSLGWNGTATGTAWFDDVSVEAVEDVAELVPLETVRWADRGFRYDDRGWIHLHVEGEPYARGYQHGSLLADEIAAYLSKLANLESAKDPVAGWNALRLLADATLLRRFDPELQEEMRGIADGAAKAGARFEGRALDFLDVVTLNSAVDLGQLKSALNVTPTALTGRSFLSAEEELNVPEGQHKCSSFSATAPATADGRIVFGQVFMWNGYTGVHFDVLLDLVPARGHRVVFQTFPGGIHSGTDFYLSDAGILVGETTTLQSPWEPAGAPQSDRIRRALQYGSSIDDVVRTLTTRNNGMYTNDWPMADVKTNEAALLLLGTRRSKLWRTKEDPAPFGTPGFLWANNNARDEGVRSEFAELLSGAPFDPVFAPWNRDLAFNAFYERQKGRIDVPSVARLYATSPINLSHACDGKITTSEMAEKLVFWAHQGKVTLREKFPAKGARRMPDLPGARPHLTHGYAAVAPVWVAERLSAARAAKRFAAEKPPAEAPADLSAVKDRLGVDKRRLWSGTIFPATEADNWLASGTAGYWQILHDLPEAEEKAPAALADALTRQNVLLLSTLQREPDLPAAQARRSYTRYAPYRVARVKGVFALHQLRLQLGTKAFLDLMTRLHDRYRNRPVRTADFLALAREVSGRDLTSRLRPWLDRTGLPEPAPAVACAKTGSGWAVTVAVTQPAGNAYALATSVEIEAGGQRQRHPLAVEGERSEARFEVAERPTRVVFDPGADVPVARDRAPSWPVIAERWPETLIVHGTSRQDEANRTLALRFQTTLADAVTEQLVPVVKDVEVTEEQLRARDLLLLGGPADNALVARIAKELPAELGRNFFRFRGRTHADPLEGLLLVLPSPFDPSRVVHILAGNSALALHEMTRAYLPALPSWAVFRGDEVKEQGFFEVERFVLEALPEERR